MIAEDNAPSPSNRRNKLGIVKANRNAALISDNPNILKKQASRANPDTRESRVVEDTIKMFFSLLYTGIYDNIWVVRRCYSP